MSIAERAYQFGARAKTKQEREEEIAYRFISRRNKIYTQIEKIKNYAEVIEANTALKELETDGYTNKYDLIMLRTKLKEKLQELKHTFSLEQEELVKKMHSIKQETYSENNVDTLIEINTKADTILLQLLMKLSKDKVKNKMAISDAIKKADRATATAIMKLSQIPAYENLITPSMKEKLLLLSKSDAEIKWQNKQNSKLEKVGKELAVATMSLFKLRKTEEILNKN